MDKPTEAQPLKAAEVAEMWRVNQATVRRWAQTGQVPAFRTPTGRWRFPTAEIRALRDGGDGHG